MNNIKIGITPEAFTKNSFLVRELHKMTFLSVKINNGSYPLSGESLAEFLGDTDGCIIGREKINRQLITRLPGLRVISKYGVGIDNIDFRACRDHGVEVRHSRGVNKRSVAELTLAFMIFLIRNLFPAVQSLKRGNWDRLNGRQLTGRTVGIIGVGNIGQELVSLLKPFACRILVNDIIDQPDYYQKNKLIGCSKEDIYKRSDILTIHTPLTGLTRNLVDRQVFRQMKKTAFLINTARAGIVNQDDLKWALQNRVIAGAAVDVFDPEPPLDREFLELGNLICTPHMGGYAREAIEAMGMAAIDNLLDFFRKKQTAT